MKKFFIFLILVLVAIGGYLLLKNKNAVVKEVTTKKYSNPGLGISFTYPKILTASASNGTVTLHHEIPYQNSGACDMMGATTTYPNLTDFNMTLKIVEKNLTDTVKELSPYIPQENFVNDELVASPGFIDPYSIGKFSGFAIYEGVEGCGQTTYYFSIENKRTLVVQKESIQLLSGAIIKEKRDEVLAVPGAISNEKSGEIFEGILQTLKIN